MKIFTLLLPFITFFCFGQNNSINKEDSLTINNYTKLIVQHINPNPDSALFYVNKIKTLSSKLNYGKEIVEANYLNACYFRRIQNSDSAIFHFNKALNFAKKIGYKKGIAKSYNGLCRIYYRQGLLDDAINSCNDCLEVAVQINDLVILPDSYLALGNIYSRKNDLKHALKYVLKVDSIHNSQELRPDIIAAAYQSIGIIYLELEQLNKSEEYFLKANNEFNKMSIDPSYYLFTTKWHLGEVYYKQGNLEKADSLLLKSYNFFNDIKDNRTTAEISKTLGLINKELKNNSDAERYLTNSFKLHKEFQNEYEVTFVALELGKLYNAQGKSKKTIEILNQTLQYKTIQKNSFLKQEAYLILAKAYAKEEKYNKAYINMNKGIRLKDSLQGIQNVVQISEIEEKYQSEKKEQEISLLTSENKLVLQQKKNQRNILLGTVSFTALTGLFFFFQYQNRKKTNKKLKELDKIKSTFFANISHEFRTPLTLISGPIQQLIKKDNLQEDERKNLQTMQVNSQRLISLVDQLLDLSKIEAGSLALQVSNNKLIHFVGTLVDSCHFIIEEKNITFIRHINPSELETWYDKTIIEKIVLNLLTNAQKYTPKNGSIVCSANVHDDRFIFEIKNSGKGINEKDLKKIFDRFYQVTNNQHGVGIGLALIKELVTLHKGTIKVTSTPNEWTTFTVELPIDKHTFQDNISEKIIDLNPEKNNDIVQDLFHSKTNLSEKETIENDLPILLLVEDNTEVRNYIYSIFKDNYSIIQATNGEEGILIAIEEIPDLIISDIMMPVKNGIELCNTLKTDERTSHIPIILLTAKVGEENELEGIKTGADDYITKPFNQELLALKVEKYIEVRKKMQDRYSQELVLKPTDITLNSTDEIFLGKVQEVIDSKIIESTFSIDKFCSSVGMSRMQLHRKLRALTGQTTSEFIRTQRLKLAADLLIDSDVNISQIGYSVGFNNPAYFSKCFKEIYHCSPSEYIKKK